MRPERARCCRAGERGPGHRGAAAPRRAPTTLGSRCCSTPTAGRTRSGCWPPGRQFLTSQWFADQGFAVVVDRRPGHAGAGQRLGAGRPPRPGRGRCSRTRSTALHGRGRADPRLDLSRVAIRGWSFGGYLAALAVLRRPDVFHAAVAGAPVTEWRLYDTHYTERYLGDPDDRRRALRPVVAAASTPIACERPLLLIHGLADDNVVAAHTLQLSSALLAAGPAAPGAAAVGRHPHDAAGGRGREPAPAPARLPAATRSASSLTRRRRRGDADRRARRRAPRSGHDRAPPSRARAAAASTTHSAAEHLAESRCDAVRAAAPSRSAAQDATAAGARRSSDSICSTAERSSPSSTSGAGDDRAPRRRWLQHAPQARSARRTVDGHQREAHQRPSRPVGAGADAGGTTDLGRSRAARAVRRTSSIDSKRISSTADAARQPPAAGHSLAWRQSPVDARSSSDVSTSLSELEPVPERRLLVEVEHRSQRRRGATAPRRSGATTEHGDERGEDSRRTRRGACTAAWTSARSRSTSASGRRWSEPGGSGRSSAMGRAGTITQPVSTT